MTRGLGESPRAPRRDAFRRVALVDLSRGHRGGSSSVAVMPPRVPAHPFVAGSVHTPCVDTDERPSRLGRVRGRGPRAGCDPEVRPGAPSKRSLAPSNHHVPRPLSRTWPRIGQRYVQPASTIDTVETGTRTIELRPVRLRASRHANDAPTPSRARPRVHGVLHGTPRASGPGRSDDRHGMPSSAHVRACSSRSERARPTRYDAPSPDARCAPTAGFPGGVVVVGPRPPLSPHAREREGARVDRERLPSDEFTAGDSFRRSPDDGTVLP